MRRIYHFGNYRTFMSLQMENTMPLGGRKTVRHKLTFNPISMTKFSPEFGHFAIGSNGNHRNVYCAGTRFVCVITSSVEFTHDISSFLLLKFGVFF